MAKVIGNTTPSKNLVGQTVTSKDGSRGITTSSGTSVAAPSGVGGAITLANQSSVNPADRYSPTATAPTNADIKTTQPSPQSVNATPFTQAPNQVQTGLTPDQVTQNLQNSGYIPPTSGGMSVADTYKKAAADLKSQPVPNSAGQAQSAVSQAVAGATPPQGSDFLGGIMDTDSNFDSILTNFDDYFSPIQQKTSLVDEYSKMSKSLGLDNLNTEIINTKRIIEGTEDDIRAEITGAGGLATDSQVLAMANARNKTLLKNYQALIDTRDSAQTQLSTMMNLTIADRDAAQKEFDTKMNYAFKVAEFQEKATVNAKNGLKWAIENGAGAQILSNPYDTQLAERTLGLPAGGLAGVVAKQQESKYGFMEVNGTIYKTDAKTGKVVPVTSASPTTSSTVGLAGSSTQLVNATTGKPDPRAQIANIIDTTGAKTDDKLKLTGAVVSAAQSFAENATDGKFEGLGLGSLKPSKLLGQAGQSNRTNLAALEGTVEAWMTGASVAEDQQKRIKSDMIPKTTDTDGQVQRKINALTNYMMSYAAGSLSTQGVNWSPEQVNFFETKVSSPDGKDTIIITD